MFAAANQANFDRKHVFQDLKPYVCTFQECETPHKAYATRKGFATHEARRHRGAHTYQCFFCKSSFWKRSNAVKHLEKSHVIRRPIGGNGLIVVSEKNVEALHCPFCNKLIDAGRNYYAQHVGRHLEEISFAVITKPWRKWEFYEETASEKSSTPSSVI
jgi:uncharacterized C2H2 Zn-finger protein